MYRFASFVLDLDRLELRHQERPVELRPKVFDVLRALVEAAPRVVPKDELLEAAWPGVATTDESLTQAISQARRALAGADPDAEPIRTHRGRGYSFEIPVEYVEREVDLPSRAADPAPMDAPSSDLRRAGQPPRRRRSGLVAALAGLAIVVAAAGGLAIDPGLPPAPLVLPPLPSPSAGGEATVAILPFQDLSPGGNYAYLGDGLAEELTGALANVPDLRVAARTSAFTFRNGSTDIPSIGDSLGVRAVVEGSVRVDGDRVRVTVQLVRSSDGFHMWAESFHRELGGLLDLQAEIAATVTEKLEHRLIERRQPTTAVVDVDAMLLYLRARAHIFAPSEEGARQAVDALDRVVEIEPGFARAWASLAEAHLSLWTDFLQDAPSSHPHLAKAEEAAVRALELAPNDSDSQRVYSKIRLYRHRDWRGARDAIVRAIELDPNNVSNQTTYASLLAKAGHLDDALKHATRGLESDPMRPAANRLIGRLHLYRAEYEQSIAYLHRLRMLNPNDSDVPSLLSKAYGEQERWDEAREAILLLFDEPGRSLLRIPARVLGPVRTMRVLVALQSLSNESRCGSTAWTGAHVFAYTGDLERMLECLERASQRSLFYVAVEPAFDPYRSDPRFREIVRRAGYDPAEIRLALSDRSPARRATRPAPGRGAGREDRPGPRGPDRQVLRARSCSPPHSRRRARGCRRRTARLGRRCRRRRSRRTPGRARRRPARCTRRDPCC